MFLDLNVSGQVMNMMRDHPGIFRQNFNQLFANYFTFFNAKRNNSIKKNAVFHPKEVSINLKNILPFFLIITKYSFICNNMSLLFNFYLLYMIWVQKMILLSV